MTITTKTPRLACMSKSPITELIKAHLQRIKARRKEAIAHSRCPIFLRLPWVALSADYIGDELFMLYKLVMVKRRLPLLREQMISLERA
jgi:hypothetical protein